MKALTPFARLGRAAVLLVAVLALGAASRPAPAPQLSAEDKADAARVEAYLNGIGTLQSRFVQVASDGSYAEGQISLKRPGKLRIEYDPPTPILIVADGSFVIYFDKDLEQTTYLGYDDTPAGILLADRISLSGKVKVTGVDRRSGVLAVSVAKSDDPAEGRLTLVFSDKPLTLRKWMITDHQGITTNFSLTDPRYSVTLADSLFRFQAPTKREENK
jgi:outer membrane lipoprotein-sorting protein